MSATQLSLYNDALMIIGERFLSSLTEEREPRRLLDQAWSSGTGAIRACLEEGQWRFATRTVQVDYDSGVEPDFGLPHAFQKPDDWVSTVAVCTDQYFRSPLLRYVDEAGYWYSDLETIYVRYISDDAGYGSNLGEWPESFRQFVAAHLASKIILRMSNSEEEEKRVMELRKRLLQPDRDVKSGGDTYNTARLRGVLDLAAPARSDVLHHAVDVLQLDAVLQAMAGYEAVMHVAGIPHPLNDPAKRVFDVNVNGSFNPRRSRPGSR